MFLYMNNSLKMLLSYKFLKALHSLELYNGVSITNETRESIKCIYIHGENFFKFFDKSAVNSVRIFITLHYNIYINFA